MPYPGLGGHSGLLLIGLQGTNWGNIGIWKNGGYYSVLPVFPFISMHRADFHVVPGDLVVPSSFGMMFSAPTAILLEISTLLRSRS